MKVHINNNFNSMRGFNKTPGQLGEYIYNSTHKPIKFRDQKQDMHEYYEKKGNDLHKKMNAVEKFNRFKKN